MEVLKWILIVLGTLVIILAAASFFLKVRIVFSFSKKSGTKSRKSFDITVCGFSIGYKAKKKSENRLTKEDDIQSEPDACFFDKVKKYYGLFLDFKDTYKKNSRKIRRTVHIDYLRLDVKFGLGEAARTGIATGGVWAGIYSVIAFVASIATLTEPKVNVVPAYNEQLCEAEAECIISARLAKLIYTLASLGISYYFISRKRKKHKSYS